MNTPPEHTEEMEEDFIWRNYELLGNYELMDSLSLFKPYNIISFDKLQIRTF